LDDDLWAALHLRARREDTTISDLVRHAVRDRYLGSLTARKTAMQAMVGIRKDRVGNSDTDAYLRSLRRGNRIERLTGK
jgi:hypothetical protein